MITEDSPLLSNIVEIDEMSAGGAVAQACQAGTTEGATSCTVRSPDRDVLLLDFGLSALVAENDSAFPRQG